jgi:hypothetical protein
MMIERSVAEDVEGDATVWINVVAQADTTQYLATDRRTNRQTKRAANQAVDTHRLPAARRRSELQQQPVGHCRIVTPNNDDCTVQPVHTVSFLQQIRLANVFLSSG